MHVYTNLNPAVFLRDVKKYCLINPVYNPTSMWMITNQRPRLKQNSVLYSSEELSGRHKISKEH